ELAPQMAAREPHRAVRAQSGEAQRRQGEGDCKSQLEPPLPEVRGEVVLDWPRRAERQLRAEGCGRCPQRRFHASRGQAGLYDTLGRRKTSTDPDLGTRVYTYDAAGNLESQTNADGTRIQYHYDALNRVYLKEFVPGAPSVQDVPDVTFTYDDPSVPFSKGQLTKLTDGTGETS